MRASAVRLRSELPPSLVALGLAVGGPGSLLRERRCTLSLDAFGMRLWVVFSGTSPQPLSLWVRGASDSPSPRERGSGGVVPLVCATLSRCLKQYHTLASSS